MASFYDAVEQGFLNQLLRGIAYTDLTPVKVSLHTADPTISGGNEVVGGSYARVEVLTTDWTAPVGIGSGSASYNVNDIEFLDMPECDVKFVGLWSSDGTVFIIADELDSGGTHITAGATFKLLAGKLRVRLN
jgi:hypothetical protein